MLVQYTFPRRYPVETIDRKVHLGIAPQLQTFYD